MGNGVGAAIRNFFHELFGSRVADTLSAQLESKRDDILVLREDFAARLQEKDMVISDLKSEVVRCHNKIENYELVLIPLSGKGTTNIFGSPAPNEPTFEPFSDSSDSDWQGVLAEHDKRQQAEADAEAKAKETDEEEKFKPIEV